MCPVRRSLSVAERGSAVLECRNWVRTRARDVPDARFLCEPHQFRGTSGDSRHSHRERFTDVVGQPLAQNLPVLGVGLAQTIEPQAVALEIDFRRLPVLDCFQLYRVEHAFEYRFLHALPIGLAHAHHPSQAPPTSRRVRRYIVLTSNSMSLPAAGKGE